MRYVYALALATATLSAAVARAAEPVSDPAVAYANGMGGATYKQGWFGKGETRLHYVEAGNGPLVILYHGFPSNWFSWFGLMEILKTRYRVVAVDGLGAGLSGKPAELGPYRVERLGKQLDSLARHLNGNQRFILVGHDWGAALSLSYAQAYPQRLHAVVGMSAPPVNLFIDILRKDAEQRQRSAYMQRFRTETLDTVRASGMGPRFARQVYRDLHIKGDLSAEQAALFEASVGAPEAMSGGINWYRANIPDFDNLGKTRRWPHHNRPISAPTLMIWGEEDKTFVASFLDQMPSYAKDLSIVRLPGIGHMTPIEKRGEANKAVAAFIDRTYGGYPTVITSRAGGASVRQSCTAESGCRVGEQEYHPNHP